MGELDRRGFLQGSLLAAAGVGLSRQAETQGAEKSRADIRGPIVDTNVYVSRWPFRRIPGDETAEVVEMLCDRGVVQAWAGSFDGVFHKDIAAANDNLVEECLTHGDGVLIPFGSVNPNLPDWEEDLRRCDEEYGMPGIRLHPNYHGYSLENPAFSRLLQMASERGLIVQLATWMEDERHQHPLMPVAEVDLAPLADTVRGLPDLRLVLLNAVHVPWDRQLPELVEAGQIYWDLARLEVIEGLAALLQRIPLQRILFGSYSPMFDFESTLLKLHESALTEAQARNILEDNARRLQKGSGAFLQKRAS